MAGGEKFMTQTLFLKFAKDSVELNLYDGDEWAQKAAEHEVTSSRFPAQLIAVNMLLCHS